MPNDIAIDEITAFADFLRDATYLAIDTDDRGTFLTFTPPPKSTTCLCYYNEGDCPVCDN